jgi:AcrR family transcriptional regulator
MADPKERLLSAAIDHVAAHGLGDLSLRRLATAIGTSHRMLIYHFGSKEGLLVALIRAVEQRQRDALAQLELAPGATPADLGRAFWRRLTDPALGPHERLFFEVYGQALQGRPGTTALLDGIVTDWLEPLVELGMRHGFPREEAESTARLGLAVARGLLLDLLATGDRAGVDAAMERFITLTYERSGTAPARTRPGRSRAAGHAGTPDR